MYLKLQAVMNLRVQQGLLNAGVIEMRLQLGCFLPYMVYTGFVMAAYLELPAMRKNPPRKAFTSSTSGDARAVGMNCGDVH